MNRPILFGKMFLVMACCASPWSLQAAAPYEPTTPLPFITQINPNAVTAGSKSFVLTILGGNFDPRSIVRWNGQNRATTILSATSAQAVIPASDVSAIGVAAVAVYTPVLNGLVSNSLVVTIARP